MNKLVYYVDPTSGKLETVDVPTKRNLVAIEHGMLTTEYSIHEVNVDGKTYNVTANTPDILIEMKERVKKEK